ncbi:protein O-linked-mannose beta-1,2-N-acetylglucosaminyltransferase 1-like [Macrobrachium nipponense]|uniref:protein O-linked-mannose beta-1,2-N-acetylglucosaminyltransferase 1-like n=1 Tax=Macrobrachium nipponense TaxID=159736 RepID=UPI0030C7E5A1
MTRRKFSATSSVLLSLLLLLIPPADRSHAGVECRMVKFDLTIAMSPSVNITRTFDVEEDVLTGLSLRKDDLERSLAVAGDDGKVREIVVGDRHIPLHLNLKKEPGSFVYSFHMLNKTLWTVSDLNYTTASMDDFKDDPTVIPIQVSLDWSMAPEVIPRVFTFTLMSAPQETYLLMDNKTILRQRGMGEMIVGNVVIIVPFGGLYLWVLNPYTGRFTFNKYFNTEDYFTDRELTSTLQSLREGRVALLTTYYDVSGRLEEASKKILSSLGSFSAQHLKFRDCWAWAWLTGGGTLGEVLVTNQYGIYSLPASLQLEVTLPTLESTGRWCEKWPADDKWVKRQHFCDVYDGYGDLCSCEHPYEPRTVPKMGTWREDMGIVILAGNRTKYFYRLLKQVLDQPGVHIDHLLVSVDGALLETLKFLELFPLKYKVHQPEGTHNARISRHMRFALYSALNILHFDKFIVLEDDLILSPDFYSYMQQTSAILDRDPTVYCVSAYSHFSYEHTAFDESRISRVHSIPSYGWMVKRSILTEILPKWIPEYVQTDWDYWMGSGLIRKQRETIIPEISRTSHAGLQGSHFSGFLTKKRYSNKPTSRNPHAIVNTTMVEKSEVEGELKSLLDRATLLNVTNPYTFVFPNASGDVSLVFVKLKHEEDAMSFRILADALNIWNQDTRDHHFGLWRLPFYKATLLIMGLPYSKYSKYYRKSYHIFTATKETTEKMTDNFNEDRYYFKSHQPGDDELILGLPANSLLLPNRTKESNVESDPLRHYKRNNGLFSDTNH